MTSSDASGLLSPNWAASNLTSTTRSVSIFTSGRKSMHHARARRVIPWNRLSPLASWNARARLRFPWHEIASSHGGCWMSPFTKSSSSGSNTPVGENHWLAIPRAAVQRISKGKVLEPLVVHDKEGSAPASRRWLTISGMSTEWRFVQHRHAYFVNVVDISPPNSSDKKWSEYINVIWPQCLIIYCKYYHDIFFTSYYINRFFFIKHIISQLKKLYIKHW